MPTGPKDWSPSSSASGKELRRKIQNAITAADGKFWEEIAKAFPEVTSGDFSPDQLSEWNEAKDQVVYWWLRLNHPRFSFIEKLLRKIREEEAG